jgi:hypothetical protein
MTESLGCGVRRLEMHFAEADGEWTAYGLSGPLADRRYELPMTESLASGVRSSAMRSGDTGRE